MVYTLIVDFEGSTMVAQVADSDIKSAMLNWANSINVKEWVGLDENGKHLLIEELKEEDRDIVQISDTKNVWCVTELVNDKLFLIHIVNTDVS